MGAEARPDAGGHARGDPLREDHNLGFTIPYTIGGEPKSYYPDFLVHLDDGHGPADPLRLIIEVTGQSDRKKEAKVSTARDLWIPAVNNAGKWGRWEFLEIKDPWDAANEIRKKLEQEAGKT